jgi:hypothetical protein
MFYRSFNTNRTNQSSSLRISYGTTLDQEPGNLVGLCNLPRRHSLSIHCIDVGAALEQESRNFDTVIDSRVVQRRHSIQILCIDVNSALKQELDQFDNVPGRSIV